MTVDPETYRLRTNAHAPNSNKPVLIYRDCLPLPLSESKAKEFLESHAWIQGGTWGHIPKRHFHPNTHECYGMVQVNIGLIEVRMLTKVARHFSW